VDVPLQGVAEDDGLVIAVLGKQVLQVEAGGGEQGYAKATSSMMTVVPGLRTAPTAGKVPLRTFHRRSISAGSVVKAGASISG
jgi:hypothetical protein